MKRLTILLFVFIPFIVNAQTAVPIVQGSKYYQFRNAVRMDSALFIPRKDTIIYDATLRAPSMLTGRPQDSMLYYYTGSKWLKLITDLDTTSLSSRIDQKLNTSDTVGMLSSYLRKVDTTGKWKPLSWFPGVSEVTGLQDSLNIRYISIPDVATLRTKDGGDYPNVILRGYYSNNDGGGGIFTWVDTSTAADNGGTIFAVTGVDTGRWHRQYTGPVNVRWFGAKGDGVTNDQPAIQAAVDMQLNVYVPPGGYYMANTLTLYQREFKGAGSANTTFKIGPGIDGFVLKQNPSTGRLNTEISGFNVNTLDTNRNNYCFRAQQYSIDSPSVGLKIHNVDVSGYFGCAFAFYNMFRLDMSNVGISRCWNGIAILGYVIQSSFYAVTANSDIPTGSTNSTLFGGVLHGAIIDQNTYNSVTSRPESVKMMACSFVNYDIGVKVQQVFFCSLDQMDIDLCRNIGVRIYAADGGFYLTNSWINLNGNFDRNGSAGVDMSTAVFNRRPVTVQNCNISINGSVTQTYYGIKIGGDPSDYYKRAVQLINNAIVSPFTYGIYANRTRELKVIGNQIDPCVTAEIQGVFLEQPIINDNTAARIIFNSDGGTAIARGNVGTVTFTGTSTGIYDTDNNLIMKSRGAGINVTSPSSTLHVGGSTAYPINATSGNLTVGTHRTIRVTNSSHVITLPMASTCSGRIYVLVNYNTGGDVTISSVNRDGAATTSLPNNAKWTVQSDGTNWYVIQD